MEDVQVGKVISTKTSPIWQYFSVIDRNHANCNICNTKLSYRTSISNLRKHLVRKHALNVDSQSDNEKFLIGENDNEKICTGKRSNIWEYFIRVDKNFAICNECNVQLSYRTSTSNLAKHLSRKHPTMKFLPHTSAETHTPYSIKDLQKSNFSESEISEIESPDSPQFKTEVAEIESDLNETEPERTETITIKRIKYEYSSTSSESEHVDHQSSISTSNHVESKQMESNSAKEIKRRKKKSNIWGYFTTIDCEYASCNICNIRLSYRTSVTNLKKHYDRKHPSVDYKDQQKEKLLNTAEAMNLTADLHLTNNTSRFIPIELSSSMSDSAISTSVSRNVDERSSIASQSIPVSELTQSIAIPEQSTRITAGIASQRGDIEKFEQFENPHPQCSIKQGNWQRSAEEEENIFGKFVASELRRIKNKKIYLEVKKKIQISLMDAVEKDYEDYSSQA